MPEQFIKMKKNGEIIEVAPENVAPHKLLGWSVVGEAAVAVETVATVAPVSLPAEEEKSPVSKKAKK